MIVGFVITSFRGKESEAVDFIEKVCILDNPSMAQNIVNLGPGVNIFTTAVTKDLLKAQPFSCSPIEVANGRCLIVSAVEFNVEILYKGEIFHLRPTEYIEIPLKDSVEFSAYEDQGIIKVIPEIDDVTKQWILNKKTWKDTGVWMDSFNWTE